MGWTKSDAFQLWTALAVTGGLAVSAITYGLARRLARISGPNLQEPRAFGKAGHPKHLVELNIEPPDHTKWRIAEVTIKAPANARIGLPSLSGAKNAYLSEPAEQKRILYGPNILTAHVIVDLLGPSIAEFEVEVALRTNPKVTSRLTTHARIPA